MELLNYLFCDMLVSVLECYELTHISYRISYHKMSGSREIGCYNDRIALEFDSYLHSVAVEAPVKF